MNRDELARELGQTGAAELLESARLARLAYNGPDGLPRVIPIGFHWNGGQIVICTATTAPKANALVSRPEVAVTIDVGSTPSEAKALLVRGSATVEIVDGVPDEYLAASRKSLDREQAEMFERQVRSMYPQIRASRSSRNGLGSTTSEPAAFRRFSRSWRAKPTLEPEADLRRGWEARRTRRGQRPSGRSSRQGPVPPRRRRVARPARPGGPSRPGPAANRRPALGALGSVRRRPARGRATIRSASRG